jgi:hypothetical protein
MKKKMILALVLAVSCMGLPGLAQMGGMQTSKSEALPSPRHTADVDLNGKKIHVSYGAPSMRGRKIMGDLVSYGRWWRVGANEATTFETTGAMMVGSLHVPAGKYTLVTEPSAGVWQLVICKHTGQWGTERYEADDLGKVPMTKATLPSPQEVMSITFEKTAGNKTQLHVKWETTDVWVPITTM